MNKNYYSVVDSELGSTIVEAYTFFNALKITENLTKELSGRLLGAHVYESEKVLPTVETVKAEGRMIVSLRVIR